MFKKLFCKFNYKIFFLGLWWVQNEFQRWPVQHNLSWSWSMGLLSIIIITTISSRWRTILGNLGSNDISTLFSLKSWEKPGWQLGWKLIWKAVVPLQYEIWSYIAAIKTLLWYLTQDKIRALTSKVKLSFSFSSCIIQLGNRDQICVWKHQDLDRKSYSGPSWHQCQ